MTALAAAVMPIIRLLVAVATRSGTPIARFISGTLMMPPPTPSRADTMPAPNDPTTPTAMPWLGSVVVGPGFDGGRRGRRWRRPPAPGPPGAGVRRPARSIVAATYSSRPAKSRASRRSSSRNAIDPPSERADRREQLQAHAQAQVRDVALEVHPGGRAAGHDHAHQRDADGLAQGQPEAERQQRDDEHPAAEAEQGAEHAGDRAAGEHQQPDEHQCRAGLEDGRADRPGSRD